MSKQKLELDAYERMEQHWHIMKLVHQMIHFSEVKAGMVITLFSVLLTVLFSAQEVIKEYMNSSTIFLILICCFGVLVSVSFFFSVRAFFPRFFDKNPRSVIYYGDISKQYETYTDYSKHLSRTCDELGDLEVQVAEQIHTLSGIADSKFNNVKLAVRYLVLALCVLLVSVIVFFIG